MPLKYIFQWSQNLKNRDFLLFDILIFIISPIISLFIRLDGAVDLKQYGQGILSYTFFFLFIKIGLLYYFGIYRRFWKYASVDDLAKLALVLFLITFTQFITSFYSAIIGSNLFVFLPISVSIIDGIISSMFVTGSRLSIRLIERAKQRGEKKDSGVRVLIVGAGQAGVMVLDELLRNPRIGKPVAFIDDSFEKQGMKIRSIEVFGRLDDVEKVVKEKNISKVIVALPVAAGKVIRRVAEQCNSLQVEVLTLPALHDIMDGKVSINQLRKIQVEDLLRREPNEIDTHSVSQLMKGKIVLISGAGGSIGSELCRQLLSFGPKKILLLGHGENSIFEIDQELQLLIRNFKGPEKVNDKLKAFICDIRDYNRLERIFKTEKPEIIFHAAAHKHVPLMENNLEEAVTNNIEGTKNLVKLSNLYNVKQFVLISSDKAVNPTSIMGATKRVAEKIIICASKENKCRFGAVRFGNVLGSRGSVIRTFNKQLKRGGPITVTHPEIKRYFMTIPEAVSLVLQVCVFNNGGEVFILDMGDPIKIVDLARDVIKLSGLREGLDVDIKFTGLRPGEKLFEELFIPGEVYDKTRHEKIFIAKNAALMLNGEFEQRIDNLIEKAHLGAKSEEVISLIKDIVPEFNHQLN